MRGTFGKQKSEIETVGKEAVSLRNKIQARLGCLSERGSSKMPIFFLLLLALPAWAVEPYVLWASPSVIMPDRVEAPAEEPRNGGDIELALKNLYLNGDLYGAEYLIQEWLRLSTMDNSEQGGGLEPFLNPPVAVNALSTRMAEEIVYTRVKRTTGTHNVSLKDGEPYILNNADIWDSLPNVGRMYHKFNAPGQLVLLTPEGEEQVIYDCFAEEIPCVPLDPMFSLDGKKLAFSVYRASQIKAAWWNYVDLPNQVLGAYDTEAQIYIYDIETGSMSTWEHVKGVHDINPIWLPNGKMMFSSTDGGYWRPWLNRLTARRISEARLYTANQDGTNRIDITPHELAGAVHPYLLNNGMVAYSSLWGSHNLIFGGTNGRLNGFSTAENNWSIATMTPDGMDTTTILGGHKPSFKSAAGARKTFKALHFIGQLENGDLATVNYYRINNLGLGDISVMPLQPRGVEGPAPDFLPSGFYDLATWSNSADNEPKKDTEGYYLQEKIGYPEGTPDGQLLLTKCKGRCTTVASGITSSEHLGPNIGADTGIYKTTVIPSLSVNDLALIVDSPDWHEFGARVRRERSVPIVASTTTDDHGSCILASANAKVTDAHSKTEYIFNHNYHVMANNGGEIHGSNIEDQTAIRFWKIIPNGSLPDYVWPDWKNAIGNKLEFLGDVPILADGSFSVRLPCETPYIMGGVEADGLLVRRDQVPQSLRSGEKRICSGCHLHGQQGTPYQGTLASMAGPIELLASTPVPTYSSDIKQLLESRCQSCHVADEFLWDYSKLVWDFVQDFVYQGNKLATDKDDFGLQRPYTSKYVNSMFARESLLYWKAANQRTDGRTDDIYNDDIDFGVDHPTGMTEKELRTLAGWLDSGAAR